jgi:hypothetical protein
MLQTARCSKIEIQKGTRQIRVSIAEETKEKWLRKRKHRKLPHNLDEKLVDNKQPYQWLKTGDNKGKTESIIVATSTNYFKIKLLKEEIDSKCQLCKQQEETIDLLTSE